MLLCLNLASYPFVNFAKSGILLIPGRCGVAGRCGVVGSTLAFGSIGHEFESEHRLLSHHSASVFNKLRSLAKCSLDESVC